MFVYKYRSSQNGEKKGERVQEPDFFSFTITGNCVQNM